MTKRGIFTSKDIDGWVLTRPQAEIRKDINLCKYELVTLAQESIGERYYWADRLEALDIAYFISLSRKDSLISPYDKIEQLYDQIEILEAKIAGLITLPKVKGVRGL